MNPFALSHPLASMAKERRENPMSLIRVPPLLFAGSCLALTSIHAETFEVTRLDDDPNPGSLRWAVAQAESSPGADTIIFEEALSADFANDGIQLLDELVITSPEGLTINGDGISAQPILSGGFANRHFRLTPGARLELIRIALTDGQAPNGLDGTNGDPGGAGEDGGNGGAILNEDGELILRRCTIEFCYAGNGGNGGHKMGATAGYSGDGGRGGNGGAICSTGSNAYVLVEDSSLMINGAGDGGDAGGLGDELAEGQFGAAGKGGSGGAIYCQGGELVIRSSWLKDNLAGWGGRGGMPLPGGIGGPGGVGGDGGAIAIHNTLLRLEGSTIEENSAGHGGSGGIAPIADPDIDPDIDPGINSIEGPGGDGGNGGGLFAREFDSSGEAQVLNSLFTLNRAGNGRFVLSVPPSLSGDGQAGGNGGKGGALYVLGGSGQVWRMHNTTIFDNEAGHAGYGGIGAGGGSDGPGGDGGHGGGLAFDREVDAYAAELVHLTVVNNAAGSSGMGNPSGAAATGGGIWEISGGIGLAGSGVTVANSVVSQNWADLDPELGDTLTEGRNFVGGNPLLGPLASSSGPTQILPPLPGSPLVNNGLPLANPLSEDQRGRPRPFAGAPDIGAVEARYQVDARIGKSSNPATHRIDNVYTPTGQGQTLAVRLKKMKKGRAFLSVQNDGEFLDHLQLKGPRANRTLRLKVFCLSAGNANVTTQVLAGHTSASVQPGALVLYRVDAKAKSKKRRAKQTLTYQAKSSVIGSVDAVRAKVTQQTARKKKK